MKNTKTPGDSETIMTEIVFPNDTNPLGILQGGRLLHWMDIASAICAQIHAESTAVTVFINSIQFKKPAHLGDILTIKAKITRVFNTSMEIYVEVWARSVKNVKPALVSNAYFTFVAIDSKAKPVTVPGIKPVTSTEKREYANALKRKNARKGKS
ncbi:MAG TPA: acyl-CoA thioesterase [Chitinophagales bacterium]|nr:acyl-CoA thioesterase [Chitinophagales bacterium]